MSYGAAEYPLTMGFIKTTLPLQDPEPAGMLAAPDSVHRIVLVARKTKTSVLMPTQLRRMGDGNIRRGVSSIKTPRRSRLVNDVRHLLSQREAGTTPRGLSRHLLRSGEDWGFPVVAEEIQSAPPFHQFVSEN